MVSATSTTFIVFFDYCEIFCEFLLQVIDYIKRYAVVHYHIILQSYKGALVCLKTLNIYIDGKLIIISIKSSVASPVRTPTLRSTRKGLSAHLALNHTRPVTHYDPYICIMVHTILI
jgi:hypothetical protein